MNSAKIIQKTNAVLSVLSKLTDSYVYPSPKELYAKEQRLSRVIDNYCNSRRSNH